MRLREIVLAVAIIIGFSATASASPVSVSEKGLRTALPTAEYTGYRYRRYGYRPRYYRRYGYYRPRYYRPAYYGYYRPRYYRPAYYGYRRPGIYIGF